MREVKDVIKLVEIAVILTWYEIKVVVLSKVHHVIVKFMNYCLKRQHEYISAVDKKSTKKWKRWVKRFCKAAALCDNIYGELSMIYSKVDDLACVANEIVIRYGYEPV